MEIVENGNPFCQRNRGETHFALKQCLGGNHSHPFPVSSAIQTFPSWRTTNLSGGHGTRRQAGKPCIHIGSTSKCVVKAGKILCQEAAGHPSCHHCRPPPGHSIHYGFQREDPVAWSHHQHWVQSTSAKATIFQKKSNQHWFLPSPTSQWTSCVVYICPPICTSRILRG